MFASLTQERHTEPSPVFFAPTCEYRLEGRDNRGVKLGFNSLSELAPYADDWERLAVSVPFQSWTWLSHWWRHYGADDDAAESPSRLSVAMSGCRRSMRKCTLLGTVEGEPG